MAIREDIVSSAVSFLQDPNVVTSSIESKLSFLRSKNLTQEEIDAAFARTGAAPPPPAASPAASQQTPPPPPPPPQYYQQYPLQQGWQPPPPEPPKRDWRDWFIMATAVGGVSYALYFLTKRYIYPLVAPPTPEKLEQDKATVDDKFDQAFATIEQLAKDTEALKASEQERVEKIDKLLDDVEKMVQDVKYSCRRQDEETDRLRDDFKAVRDGIPKSMANHKELTDGRLKEISNEVKSLKSLITQRLSAPAPTPVPTASTFATNTVKTTPEVKETGTVNGTHEQESSSTTTAAPPNKQDYISSLGGRHSPFGSGMPKASIPAWQMAAQNQVSDSDAGSSSQAGSSS
ncbi:hypothetical protein F5Y16DRAFT_371770 [Xylariaceae sp. FL0255]|nr:hypothetical protein F5Y16DRAFT_371770 [Xylariaceae sp. FL0255]